MSRKRAGLSQGILSFNDGGLTDDSVSLRDEARTSPRLTTPTKTNAVQKPKYLSDLSISDDETKLQSSHTRRLSPVVHEILSTQTHDDQSNVCGEVSTKTTRISSPARVVCHSPSSHRHGSVKREDRNKMKEHTTPSQQETKSSRSLSFDKSIEKKGSLSAKKNVSTDNNTSKDLHGSGAKKKKKKYIFVESRFKQPSKKDETLRSKPLELSAITPHPGLHQTSQTSQKKSRVTSTPFLMTSMYEQQGGGGGDNDGSILDQTRFQTVPHNEPPIKAPLVKKGGKTRKDKENVGASMKNKRERTKDSSRETTGKENKVSIESEQLQVDLYHARCLQQSYLHMKTLQTFDKQEVKAKNEMYSLWALNRKLEKEIEAIMLSIQTKRTEIAIDQLMNAQLNGMKPLTNKLAKLAVKTNQFADSLADITNYLNIDDILIDDEETLLKSLDESKSLLAEIQSLTRRNQPQIEELSTCSDVLLKTTTNEIRQQLQCNELIGACETLLNNELSLQAQIIQTQS